MTRVIFFITCFFVFAVAVGADAYRMTTEDMYKESYMATMRRNTGMSAAEMRAEEYRGRYEVCDEHHNCVNQTAEGLRVDENTPAIPKHKNFELPYWNMPVWLSI